MITIVEITSEASSVFDKKVVRPCKSEPRTKPRYCDLRSLAQNKRPDEKRGNPKTQGAQNKKNTNEKEATPKRKVLKIKDI
jgi:hypothetical protein